MSNQKVWFITGAGRGMGVDIAKAALAAGHKVVATGRNTGKVAKALGESEKLLITKLDVTKAADAEASSAAMRTKMQPIRFLISWFRHGILIYKIAQRAITLDLLGKCINES